MKTKKLIIWVAIIMIASFAIGQVTDNQGSVLKHDDQNHFLNAAHPLVGIGTGTVLRGGSGEFHDWPNICQSGSNLGTYGVQPRSTTRSDGTEGDGKAGMVIHSPSLFVAEARVIHVSPGGDDQGAGTKAHPFATLERARQAVRAEMGETGGTGTVTVELAPGVYHVKKTLVLGPEDSGTEQRPVVYVAQTGGTAVVSAGVPVSNWQWLEQTIPGVPVTARGSLWVAPLPEGVPNPRALFDAGGRPERHARVPPG